MFLECNLRFFFFIYPYFCRAQKDRHTGSWRSFQTQVMIDMIDYIVYNTNLYAVQKGKDKLALTSEEFKTFQTTTIPT